VDQPAEAAEAAAEATNHLFIKAPGHRAGGGDGKLFD